MRCIIVALVLHRSHGGHAMRIHLNKPLFPWDCLEDSPNLSTIRQFLHLVPDGKLLNGLRRWRGRGRNDCPVHVRRLIGIESEEKVPKKWNLSRFLDVLGREPHLTEVKNIFNTLVQKLGMAVPDLGKDTAGDATALNARGKANPTALAEEQAQGLPQPSGGRKEYKDDEGKVSKVVEWFGFKLHLLVDVKHEVSLAYEITSTKAADDNQVHALLHQAKIRPLIENRSLWKDWP